MAIDLMEVFTTFIIHLPFLSTELRYEIIENEINESGGNKTAIKWMLMPDGKDNIQPAIISGLQRDAASTAKMQSVKFMLYTRENPKQAEVRSMTNSCKPNFKYFKSKKKTKILIHGFGDNVRESYMIPILRDAFLSKGDYNIIAVDWSELAARPWYGTAAENTSPVAKHVAQFIDHMSTTTKTKPKDMHIVGFSLGAHVAGIAGNNVRSGKIAHITGLDPAFVSFSSAGPDMRLDSSHAELVEVVHTSGGYIGFEKPIGHRDFYPNGGMWPQPGCDVDYVAVCSHRRAYYYYGEAVSKNRSFIGIPCESYKHFLSNKCDSTKKENVELGSTLHEKRPKNSYFLKTNPKSPFGSEVNFFENKQDRFDRK